MALQRVSTLLDQFVAQQPQYARMLGARQPPRQGPSQEELLTAGLLSGLTGDRQRQLLRGMMGGGMRVRLHRRCHGITSTADTRPMDELDSTLMLLVTVPHRCSPWAAPCRVGPPAPVVGGCAIS